MNAAHGATFDTMRILGRDQASTIARVTAVAQLLDNAFFIPGLNRRVGLDSIIGLVPGIGDAVSAALASYIIFEARRLGLPTLEDCPHDRQRCVRHRRLARFRSLATSSTSSSSPTSAICASSTSISVCRSADRARSTAPPSGLTSDNR